MRLHCFFLICELYYFRSKLGTDLTALSIPTTTKTPFIYLQMVKTVKGSKIIVDDIIKKELNKFGKVLFFNWNPNSSGSVVMDSAESAQRVLLAFPIKLTMGTLRAFRLNKDPRKSNRKKAVLSTGNNVGRYLFLHLSIAATHQSHHIRLLCLLQLYSPCLTFVFSRAWFDQRVDRFKQFYSGSFRKRLQSFFQFVESNSFNDLDLTI